MIPRIVKKELCYTYKMYTFEIKNQLIVYLDEFCDNFNRRYFGECLFNRLTPVVAKIYR